MTAPFVIAKLLPDLLGINGSTGNAEILAATLTRMGYPSTTVEVNRVGDCPQPPDIVVVGSGSSSSLRPALTAAVPLASTLHQWAGSGAAFLAVGMGWDVLGTQLTLASGEVVPGVGVFDTSSDYRVGRYSGEVSGVDYRGRPIAGYINNLGRTTVHRGTTLMTITHSAKPIESDEGVVDNHLVGTKLGGPVLSLNPSLRDEILDVVLARRGEGSVADCDQPGFSEFHSRVERLAAHARAGIIARVS